MLPPSQDRLASRYPTPSAPLSRPVSSTSHMRPVQSYYPVIKPHQQPAPQSKTSSTHPGLQEPPELLSQDVRSVSSASARQSPGSTTSHPHRSIIPTRPSSVASHPYARPPVDPAKSHTKLTYAPLTRPIGDPSSCSLSIASLSPTHGDGTAPQNIPSTQQAPTLQSPTSSQATRCLIDYDPLEDDFPQPGTDFPRRSTITPRSVSHASFAPMMAIPGRASSAIPGSRPPSSFQPLQPANVSVNLAAGRMMTDMANKRWGPRLLEAQTEIGHTVDGIQVSTNTISEDVRKIRDQSYLLGNAVKILPTKDDISEEIAAQLTEANDVVLKPINRKLDSILKLVPRSANELHPMLANALEQVRDEIIEALPSGLHGSGGHRHPMTDQKRISQLDHLIQALRPLQTIKDDLVGLISLKDALRDVESLPGVIAEVRAFREAMGVLQSTASNVPMGEEHPGQSTYPTPDAEIGPIAMSLGPPVDPSMDPRPQNKEQPEKQTQGRFAAFLASDGSEDGHMAAGRLSPMSRHSFDSHVDLPPAFRKQSQAKASPLTPQNVSTAAKPPHIGVSTGVPGSITSAVDPAQFNKLCRDVTDIQTTVRTIIFKLDNPSCPPAPPLVAAASDSDVPPWAVAFGAKIDTMIREMDKRRPTSPNEATGLVVTPGIVEQRDNTIDKHGHKSTPVAASPRPRDLQAIQSPLKDAACVQGVLSPRPAATNKTLPQVTPVEPEMDSGMNDLHDVNSSVSQPDPLTDVDPAAPVGQGLLKSVRGLISKGIRQPITPLASLSQLPQPIRSSADLSAALHVFTQSPQLYDDGQGVEAELVSSLKVQGVREQHDGSLAPETQTPAFTDIADSAKRRVRTKRFLDDSPEQSSEPKKRKSTSVVTRRPSTSGSAAPYLNTRARSRSAGSSIGEDSPSGSTKPAATAALRAAALRATRSSKPLTARVNTTSKEVVEVDSDESDSLEPFDIALQSAATRAKTDPARPRKTVKTMNPRPGGSIFGLAEDSLTRARVPVGQLIELSSQSQSLDERGEKAKEDVSGLTTSNSTGSDDSRVSDFAKTTQKRKADEARKKGYGKKSAAPKQPPGSRKRSGSDGRAGGGKMPSEILGAQGAKLRALQHNMSLGPTGESSQSGPKRKVARAATAAAVMASQSQDTASQLVQPGVLAPKAQAGPRSDRPGIFAPIARAATRTKSNLLSSSAASSTLFDSLLADTTMNETPNSAAAQPRCFGVKDPQPESESPLFPSLSLEQSAQAPVAVVTGTQASKAFMVGGRSIGDVAGGGGRPNATTAGVGGDETLVSAASMTAERPVVRYGSRNGGVQISERRVVRGPPPLFDSDED